MKTKPKHSSFKPVLRVEEEELSFGNHVNEAAFAAPATISRLSQNQTG